MTLAVRIFALSALVLGGTTALSAQGASIASDLLKDWVAQEALMMKIAAEMPEDKFGYKSTPPQRSYGEQILHVAQVNMAIVQTLGAKTPAPTINQGRVEGGHSTGDGTVV